jgi:hypothetical protein
MVATWSLPLSLQLSCHLLRVLLTSSCCLLKSGENYLFAYGDGLDLGVYFLTASAVVSSFSFFEKSSQNVFDSQLSTAVATPEFTLCTATTTDEFSVDPLLQSLYLTDSKTMSPLMEEVPCI